MRDQKIFGLFYGSCRGKIKNKIVGCRSVSIVLIARNVTEACRRFNVEIIGDPVGIVKVQLPREPPVWFRRGIAEATRKKLWSHKWLALKTAWYVEQVPMIYD